MPVASASGKSDFADSYPAASAFEQMTAALTAESQNEIELAA